MKMETTSFLGDSAMENEIAWSSYLYTVYTVYVTVTIPLQVVWMYNYIPIRM